jgi:hypothetical protein
LLYKCQLTVIVDKNVANVMIKGKTGNIQQKINLIKQKKRKCLMNVINMATHLHILQCTQELCVLVGIKRTFELIMVKHSWG